MKLRALRKEKQLTVDEIAQKVGLSAQCIYNYETGKREPSITTIFKIAEIMKVPVDDVLNCFKDDEK